MKNMNTRQGGMTAIGFIIILLMVGFLTMIALKLMPIYFENFKINSVLKSLKDEQGIIDKTNNEIHTIVAHRFNIDNIDRAMAEQIKIKRDRSKITINLDYEVRKNFVSNIDVAVTFEDTVVIAGR